MEGHLLQLVKAIKKEGIVLCVERSPHWDFCFSCLKTTINICIKEKVISINEGGIELLAMRRIEPSITDVRLHQL